MESVTDFQKTSGGAKGLNLPNILEEIRVFGKFLGILAHYTCFS